MPTESELRALLRGEPGGTPQLDARRIISAARARRRPKRLAAGALGGLATLALVIPVAVGIGSLGPRGASDSGGAAAPAHSESEESVRTNADDSSLSADPHPGCRLPSWDGEAVPSGVELRVNQSTPGGTLEMTLVNGSATALHGRLAGPPLVAVRNGDAPLGWSAAAANPASDAERIALAPGEQRTFGVPLEVDTCSGEPVTGTVDVEAAIAIVLDDGATVVASSARSSIVIAPAQ